MYDRICVIPAVRILFPHLCKGHSGCDTAQAREDGVQGVRKDASLHTHIMCLTLGVLPGSLLGGGDIANALQGNDEETNERWQDNWRVDAQGEARGPQESDARSPAPRER